MSCAYLQWPALFHETNFSVQLLRPQQLQHEQINAFSNPISPLPTIHSLAIKLHYANRCVVRLIHPGVNYDSVAEIKQPIPPVASYKTKQDSTFISELTNVEFIVLLAPKEINLLVSRKNFQQLKVKRDCCCCLQYRLWRTLIFFSLSLSRRVRNAKMTTI